MFSTVVAWGVFAVTSLILVAVAYDQTRRKDELEQALEQLEQAATGRRKKLSLFRLLIVFAVWFAAGVYLMG